MSTFTGGCKGIFTTAHSKGLLFAAVAGISLAFITPFARVTYDSGSGPLTMVAVRIGFGAVVLWSLAMVSGHGIAVVTRAWPSVLLGAVSLGVITFGYMLSVAYIPVGLAALVFYTFPLVVLGVEIVRARQLPGAARVGVFVAAFIGLGFALGPDAGDLDPLGVALAFVGGLGTVTLLLAGKKASEHMAPISFAALCNLLLAPVGIVVVVVFDAFAAPSVSVGWLAFAGAGFAYLIGVSAQISAVKYAPPGDVALVHNIEPVVSILIAWVLLGETLSGMQTMGVALVMVAVIAGTRMRAG